MHSYGSMAMRNGESTMGKVADAVERAQNPKQLPGTILDVAIIDGADLRLILHALKVRTEALEAMMDEYVDLDNPSDDLSCDRQARSVLSDDLEPTT